MKTNEIEWPLYRINPDLEAIKQFGILQYRVEMIIPGRTLYLSDSNFTEDFSMRDTFFHEEAITELNTLVEGSVPAEIKWKHNLTVKI